MVGWFWGRTQIQPPKGSLLQSAAGATFFEFSKMGHCRALKRSAESVDVAACQHRWCVRGKPTLAAK